MTSNDPFDVLGIEPAVNLDADELEERYLALSREAHPDYHADSDPAAMAERLERAAAINDAYRTLRDPWRRARALCDRLDPAAFGAGKRLDPAFLAEALEVAEEVATCEADARAKLTSRLRAAVDEFVVKLDAALASADAKRAAELLHQSQYYRKALADLTAAGRP